MPDSANATITAGPTRRPRPRMSAALPPALAALVQLNTRQAAALAGLSDRTMEKMRLDGIGPPWRKVGGKSVRYRSDELIAWLDRQPAVVGV